MTLSAEDIAHMVDQVVNARIHNNLQQQIGGSVDGQLESNIDSRFCSAMLRANDDFNKKQLQSVEPSDQNEGDTIYASFGTIVLKIDGIILILEVF